MDLSAIASGLASNPSAWLLTLALAALVYLYKARSDDQKVFLDRVLAQEAAHRETIMRIVPIAEKLTDSVEILERVTNAALKE
jgi:hypothetical protein